MPLSDKPTRKLAAIMFTDIADFTALSAKDSLKASELLKTQRKMLSPIVLQHNGSWMKEIGDGLLLTFDSATSAVECAVAIQQVSKDIDNLNLRIGIHEGEVIKQDDDVIGDDVNIASRIEPFSSVGGIAISHKIQQAISSNQDFDVKYIGIPRLKGVMQEVKVYCIISHGLPATQLSKVSAKLEVENSRKYGWNIFTYTGLCLTIIGMGFWIGVTFLGLSFGSETAVPSIAILMMENRGSVEDEFWSLGITEDLIIKVASAGLIRVSPTKEIREVDMNKEFKEIANSLRVRYLLTSSLYKRVDGFDLRCQLIEGKTGVSMYANKWSEPLKNSPNIVGKLADDILKILEVSTKQKITMAPTSNTEAYEFYLKARYKFWNRQNIEDMKIARGLLYKAIELDDNLLYAKRLLAYTYNTEGKYDKSLDLITQNFQQAETLGDKNGMGDARQNMGVIYNIKGEYEKAMDCFNYSMKISEDLGNQAGVSSSLNGMGMIYWRRGETDQASDCYTRSLKINEELDNRGGIAYALKALGVIFRTKGNYKKSLEKINQSLEIIEEIGYKRGIGAELNNMGTVYQKIGDNDMALENSTRSLDIAKELGDKFGESAALHCLGLVYYSKGEYNKGISFFEQSLTLQKEMGVGANDKVGTTAYLSLSYKYMNKKYDKHEILMLIDQSHKIEFEINFCIYQLLEDKLFLETAYKQVQTLANDLKPKPKKSFLNYPIPKAITEEWKKINNPTSL